MNPRHGIQRITHTPGHAARAWALHDAVASRALEQAACAERPAQALMAHAGAAVAKLALALTPHAQRVQVWCGPGNNGGDGLVAARHLHACGKTVQVALLADAARLPPDARWALQQAIEAGVPLQTGLGAAGQADLSIDALLGLGARRAPEGTLAAAIGQMNAHAAPVLAVDLPSGLHADTGQVLGAAAVRAQYTLALLTLKPGCHTGQGRDHAGQVWLDTLGVSPGPPTAWLGGAPPALPRRHAAHKGSQGDLVVVGGAPGMTGAAWLAARAALAAGAGRVYACLLDGQASVLDWQRPELMMRPMDWLLAPTVLSGITVVCGCGGGTAIQTVLPPLLSRARRLVLDADALNTIAADPGLQTLLQARSGRGLPTLITPHPLEAARLLGCSTAQVQHDRLAAAQALADRFGLSALLKGSGSVIASPACIPTINPSGNGALATAGTGDVLAGWIGGLWAQQPQAVVQTLASGAAWQHGAAADQFMQRWPHAPLRAADLVEQMTGLAEATLHQYGSL